MSELPTLAQHFRRARPGLERRLPATVEPDEAMATVTAALAQLQIVDVSQRSLAERRAVQQGLELIQLALEGVRLVEGTAHVAPPRPRRPRRGWLGRWLDGPRPLVFGQVAVGVGILVLWITLLQAEVTWLPIVGLVMVVVLLLLQGMTLALLGERNETPTIVAPARPTVTLGVRRTAWLDEVAASVAKLDDVIAQVRLAEERTDAAATGLADEPELLAALQRVAGAVIHDRPDRALERARLLVATLEDQGIAVVVHDDPHAPPPARLFDTQRSVAGTDYRTVLPALVQGERVLARGGGAPPPPTPPPRARGGAARGGAPKGGGVKNPNNK